jgi:tRNA(fMet)-specific endonuclease VapC
VVEGPGVLPPGTKPRVGPSGVRYLLDTDWIIDAFGGSAFAQRVLNQLSGDGIGVSITSYGEVFEGAFSDPDPSADLALFSCHLATFQPVPLAPDIMKNFARTRANLRSRGQLIPDPDIQFAATSIRLNLSLLTRDLHQFTRVAGLKIDDPSSAP